MATNRSDTPNVPLRYADILMSICKNPRVRSHSLKQFSGMSSFSYKKSCPILDPMHVHLDLEEITQAHLGLHLKLDYYVAFLSVLVRQFGKAAPLVIEPVLMQTLQLQSVLRVLRYHTRLPSEKSCVSITSSSAWTKERTYVQRL